MLKFILPLFLMASFAHADVSVPRAKQYAWFSFDASGGGGSSTSHSMGLVLPARAVITNMYVYINTQFAATGTDSLGISCAGNQDLMTYQSIKNIGADHMLSARINGANYDGTAALIGPSPTNLGLNTGFVSVPTNCSVVVNVRGNSGDTPYTAGNLDGGIEFFRF